MSVYRTIGPLVTYYDGKKEVSVIMFPVSVHSFNDKLCTKTGCTVIQYIDI